MAHLLDLYQYRVDGRLADEIRNVSLKFNVTRQADGSVCWEQGNTSILASIYGPHEVDDSHRSDSERGIINCNFSQSSFTSVYWRRHQSAGRRVHEIEQIIKKAFEGAIQLELFPRSQIDIFLEVLQADGGILSSCINSATLALIDAGIPLLDFVCASSAAIIKRTVVADISSSEDVQSIPQLTLAVMPKKMQFVQLSVSGRIHCHDLVDVIDSAMSGCRRIHQIMRESLQRHLAGLTVTNA